MYNKFFILILSVIIAMTQANLAVLALEEDTAIAPLMKLDVKKELPQKPEIKDDIPVSGFTKEQLVKPQKSNKLINDQIILPAETQLLKKIIYQKKFIDDSTEQVNITVASAGVLVTKQKRLFEGEQATFKTTCDVIKDGNVFIKKDTPVNGYVETITKSSFSGDPAELIIGRFTTKDVNGNTIDLIGEVKKNGANRGLWVKPLMYVGYCVPIFGSPLLLLYFVKGGNAKIKPKNKFVLIYE